MTPPSTQSPYLTDSPSRWSAFRHLALSLILGLGVLVPGGPVGAQEIEIDRTEPAVITADEVLFDEALRLVIARGSVEVSQGERLLQADQVVYNSRTDVVTATGNVVLVDEAGDVLFADFVELQGDLAEGFIDSVGIVLSDQSRVAATGGVRRADRVTEVERAVYSPCRLCEEDPTRPPLWQLRAVRVTQDQETRDVVYRDAFLDFFGIPVLYTPYLRHPDPSVEQRSGFLAPSIGRDENLGTFVNIPYYIAIDPSRDLTLTGGLTTDSGPILRGLYRDRLNFGEIEVDASINFGERTVDQGEPTEREEDQFRGHLFADGQFAIDENWRATAAIQVTSDETYLDTFNITDDDVLRTSGLLEGFFDLSYASAEIISYRDLREDTESQPLVAPVLSYSHVGTPGGLLGGTWMADANFLHLRDSDLDTTRLIGEASWGRRDILPLGLVSDIQAGLRQDLYFSDGAIDPDDPTVDDTEFGHRTIPQGSWILSYPWIGQTSSYRHVVEPMVGVFASGIVDNDSFIPNNDSLDAEFDDISLFANDRFPGFDLIDDGVRLAYGVRNTLQFENAGRAEVFLGQSFRIADESGFPDGTEDGDRLADLVGRVSISPIPEVDLSYRFQFDSTDFESLRHEVTARSQLLDIDFSANYFFIDASAGSGLDENQSEFVLRTEVPINDRWRVGASWRRDLDADENREISVGAQYADECFLLRIDYRRDFTEDRDRESGDSVIVQIGLRNVGQSLGDSPFASIP